MRFSADLSEEKQQSYSKVGYAEFVNVAALLVHLHETLW
jgi:hypothetical protein